MSKSFASHEKSKYWSYDKNKISPKEITYGTRQKFWFLCGDCNHQFEKSISNITNKTKSSRCPYCSKPSKKLCIENCTSCFEKSFASVKYSSNIDIDKNDINAKNIFKSSDNRIWMKCPSCCHSFNTVIKNITKGHLCPFCANQNLCGEKECKICYKKSLASIKESKYWNYSLNNIDPIKVFLGSNNRYSFNCNICNHTFQIKPCEMKYKNKWCTYCSGGFLCTDNDCNICFNKSFASHPKSKYFSKKNNVNPRKLFKNSNKKYIFDCLICNHEFTKPISKYKYKQLFIL